METEKKAEEEEKEKTGEEISSPTLRDAVGAETWGTREQPECKRNRDSERKKNLKRDSFENMFQPRVSYKTMALLLKEDVNEDVNEGSRF